MRVLVTGAGGFVGRHLLAALGGHEVLDRRFDVTDRAACLDAVQAAAPGAVIHLAAVAAPAAARRDPGRAWAVNLHGTLNLADAVLAHAPTALFLFAGTADAYGQSFRGGGALDETAALAPLNLYGATKAAADLALCALAAEGLRAVRLRPFNHTGPGQSESFVVPAFARQVARIEAGLQPPVLEVGALDPCRDFLDVRDVVAAYARCLDRPPPPGTVLNLASGTPRRVGAVLEALLELAGVRAEVRTAQARLRATDIPTAAGDAGRARALLDWTPRIAWETTLADVLADWRQRVRA